ncbi:MAG: hypothetical protein IPJ14_06260 [Kineosporiaceae bacterium]|nr:hypothetical protein [Kineosporiaceae bacterium]MBK8074594.1 hypothetical protein [Kineosporiaceae bacterium]
MIRQLGPVDRIAQYVMLPRIAAAGLTFSAVGHMSRGWLVLSIATPLLVAVNYLALRHWVYVVDVVEVGRKPLYLVLDIALALSLIALVGIGTPLVLYLVGCGALGGLLYRARLALVASLAMVAGYAVLVVTGTGSAPASPDIHTLITLPAMVLASGPAAAGVRRLLRRHERLASEVAVLRAGSAVHEERLRVARDLHDNVTKSLHGLWLVCSSLTSALDRGDVAAARSASDLVGSTARNLAEQTRVVIYDLRHDEADQPFRRELERAAQAAAADQGLVIDVDVPAAAEVAGRALPAEARRQVVAIVGEAVHNTVKHAQARRLQVSAIAHPDALEVCIRDDGVGYSSERAALRVARGHIGVVGMTERAHSIGATFGIAGEAGRGTEVALRVPVAQSVPAAANGRSGRG